MHGRPCRLAAGALVLLLAGASACTHEGPESARTLAPAAFTVRGRLEDPRSVTWSLDLADCPVDAGAFRAAVVHAQATWAATGVVGFREADPGETPDVVYAWRSGAHGTCDPFGFDTSVAHTGPVRRGTFVHLDAGRDWSPSGGLSLAHTALHETGHVLGLGHSTDPEAVMYATDDAVRESLGTSDLAGLHSLYGGGRAGPGDLTITSADEGGAGAVAACLRGIAPPSTTAFDLFDTDGDGKEELLVWRTDPAGYGALTVYSFGPGPVLVRTLGPMLGMAAPGAPTYFGVDESGERVMATALGGQRVRALRFDDAGRLSPRPQEPLRLGTEFVDDDGDGLLDRGLPATAAPLGTARSGDLDGDGVLETVDRRTSPD